MPTIEDVLRIHGFRDDTSRSVSSTTTYRRWFRAPSDYVDHTGPGAGYSVDLAGGGGAITVFTPADLDAALLGPKDPLAFTPMERRALVELAQRQVNRDGETFEPMLIRTGVDRWLAPGGAAKLALKLQTIAVGMHQERLVLGKPY